jgi:hypothetical protein
MITLGNLSLSVATLTCIAASGTTLASQTSHAPAATVAAASPVTGVWRCELDGLPAMTMVISDEGGSLTGAVLFYFHVRKTVNDPWASTPGLPEPMFNLHFVGNTLSFQVSHRRAHPPATLNDPPVRFHLTITGPNQGELVNENEGPGCSLVRSDQ